MNKKVLLNTVDKVKKFVDATSKFPFNVYLKSGRYIIDAKSIMGIFSLDLTKPIELDVDESANSKQIDVYMESIEAFIHE